MPLVGGDLSNSSSKVVSETAWGHLNSGAPLCRSGARAGDHVLLVGRTGYARLGLEYLEQIETEGLASISDEAELVRWAGMAHCYEWLKSFFLPEIHAEAASWIAENGLAHSMIDVSDGLGQDLLHILEESQLSGEIELTRLSHPIGVEDRKRAREYALNGGEDYALLFTVSEEQLEILKKDYPQDFTPFTVIGRLFTGPAALYLVDEDGRKSEYQPEGFHHFP
jgi:thiamine-monophosphate kinase